MVWKLVPVDPTGDMVVSAVGVRPGGAGYSDVAAKCIRDWNAMVKSAPPSPALEGRISGRAVTVDELARHLFETDDPEAEELSWPEHDDDDGERGDGGWVKLLPALSAEEYRDRARTLLRFMGCEVK